MSCPDCEKYRRLHHAARSLWLFSRGYVSDGKAIPEHVSDDEIDGEEAGRSLALFDAVKELEPTPHPPRRRRRPEGKGQPKGETP